MNKNIFILLIIIIFFIIYINNINENFNSDNEINNYNKPIKNIFLGDNYYNYKLNYPKINKNYESLKKITLDSYLYSKPITQKIICSNHKNIADCWQDNVNNCQWIHKIDSNDSYCNIGPKLL
jgi:hypothetical protein